MPPQQRSPRSVPASRPKGSARKFLQAREPTGHGTVPARPTGCRPSSTFQLLRATAVDPAVESAVARLEAGFQWNEEFRDVCGSGLPLERNEMVAISISPPFQPESRGSGLDATILKTGFSLLIPGPQFRNGTRNGTLSKYVLAHVTYFRTSRYTGNRTVPRGQIARGYR